MVLDWVSGTRGTELAWKGGTYVKIESRIARAATRRRIPTTRAAILSDELISLA